MGFLAIYAFITRYIVHAWIRFSFSGQVINQDDLVVALRSKRIRGAALDAARCMHDVCTMYAYIAYRAVLARVAPSAATRETPARRHDSTRDVTSRTCLGQPTDQKVWGSTPYGCAI